MNKSCASPVRIVTPLESTPPQDPLELASPNFLKELLYPLTVQEFMTQDFRQRAVHIQAQPQPPQNTSSQNGKKKKSRRQQKTVSNRYQPIIDEGMYHLDTKELLKETSSDSIFVWLAAQQQQPQQPKNGNKKAPKSNASTTPTTTASSNHTTTKQPLIQSIEIPDAETAMALHQSSGGHALYCRAPPQVEQLLVSQLLRDTGLGCGQYDPSGESTTKLARGEVEMFLTSKAGGITDWHFDFQENFTLQLSGVKRWTLQRGSVAHPLRACTPHYKAPEVVESQLKAAHVSGVTDFCFDQPKTQEPSTNEEKAGGGYNAIGPVETITLHPGDAFYFPAGMWHTIEVLEPGVSINVSLMATNFANITCQALQHYLLQRDEWRQEVVHYNPNCASESHKQNSNNNSVGLSLNAVDHLKQLLKELPGIVAEFEQQQGGAQAILPPVLLHPPQLSKRR